MVKTLTKIAVAVSAASLLTMGVINAPTASAAGTVNWDAMKISCSGSAVKPKDGKPIMVSLPPSLKFEVGKLGGKVWKNPPSRDASWNMWFYSFLWAQGATANAVKDGQDQSVDKIINQIGRFYAENPDTGKSLYGWDEGTSLRRLQTLNCVYSLTKSTRVKGWMAKEVNVLTGPRYYGPPNFKVHNHGLMANMTIFQSGALTHNKAWVDKATNRMGNEITMAFSSSGMAFEQSAKYQNENYVMWNNAANMIARVYPSSPVAHKIASRMNLARQATAWVTEPDGKVSSVGDSVPGKGVIDTGKSAKTFRDDATGWMIGRWSWKDPNTTYFSVRYGPGTWAHGHSDKSSVVWSNSGARILVGPGYSTYDPVSPKNPWWKKPYAHNVATAVGKTYNQAAKGTSGGISVSGSKGTARVTDTSYGTPHTRTVSVDDARNTISISDAWGKGVKSTQQFHLDSRWQLVSNTSKTVTARDKLSNKKVTFRTNGTITRLVVGSSKYQDGWQYVTMDKKVNNISITVSSSLRTTTSTLGVQ